MYLECLCIGLIGQNWYYNIVIAFFLLMTINPSVKIKRIFVFHMIGAIGALVMAVFGIWLYYELFKLFIVAVITILLSVFLLRHRSNIIYLTETISILIIIIGMILGTLHKLNYINLVWYKIWKLVEKLILLYIVLYSMWGFHTHNDYRANTIFFRKTVRIPVFLFLA